MVNVHTLEFKHRRTILFFAVACCTLLAVFAESAKAVPAYGYVVIGLLFLPSAYFLGLLLGRTLVYMSSAVSNRTVEVLLIALFYLCVGLSVMSLVVHFFIADIGIKADEYSLFYAQSPAGLFAAAGLLRSQRGLLFAP